MHPLKTALLSLPPFLCLFIIAPFASADELRQEKFSSPSGKYLVVFTELTHRKFRKEEVAEGRDKVSRILYRIDFINKGAKEPSATVNYTDAYGWEPKGRPSPTGAIFRMIAWSPNEDLAILPPEEWAGAPGTTETRAVAIGSLPWKEARLRLENLAWIDNYRAVGDYHNDCDYGVAVFNGAIGKMSPVKASESPIGYELISVAGTKARIRMVLDNCRMQEVAPRCLSHDLSTGEDSVIPCAVQKKKTGR